MLLNKEDLLKVFAGIQVIFLIIMLLILAFAHVVGGSVSVTDAIFGFGLAVMFEMFIFACIMIYPRLFAFYEHTTSFVTSKTMKQHDNVASETVNNENISDDNNSDNKHNKETSSIENDSTKNDISDSEIEATKKIPTRRKR